MEGHLLRDSGHQVALKETKEGAQRIKAKQKQQDAANSCKINASGTCDLRSKSLEDFRGGFSKNLRADDVKYGTSDCENHNQKNCEFIAADITDHLSHRLLEILWLLSRLYTVFVHRAAIYGWITHELPPFPDDAASSAAES